MSEVADFLDAALQYEVSPYSYPYSDDGLTKYGTSVGAIRGSVRDALKKFPGMSRDDVLALCSELWSVPVVERRVAAVVLMQTRIAELRTNDLTRIEGFLRRAGADAIVQQLLTDVLVPLILGLDPRESAKADQVLRRWSDEADPTLREAALAVSRARS